MSDEWVSSLTPSQKEELLVRALAELRKSRDRLNQTPNNSSRPPSSRAPWESTRIETDVVASTGTAPMTVDAAAAKGGDAPSPLPASTTSPGKSVKSGIRKAGKQVGAKGFG
ncbi:hypothetical protein PO883_34625, partial [Massilia sp. DJPM01]|nr:hypothetical protein [Massilia sp. DJPM01]